MRLAALGAFVAWLFVQVLAAQDLELQVRESAGVARDSCPVTSGVPFPAGQVAAIEQLSLKDAAGATVPCQFQVLSRWPDQSLRVVLLDFQASVGAGETKIFALSASEPGQATRPAKPLRVERQVSSATIETGAAYALIARDSSALLASLQLDRDGDGKFTSGEAVVARKAVPAFTVTDTDGLAYTELVKMRKVELEEQGFMRGVVRMTGQLRCEQAGPDKWFEYCARVHAYAGKSYFRVQFTLERQGPAMPPPMPTEARLADLVAIRDIELAFPRVTSDASSWRSACDGKDIGGTGAVQLTQIGADAFAVTGDAPLSGKKGAGWLAVDAPTVGMTVALRHFADTYPKRLQVSDKGLSLILWRGEDPSRPVLEAGPGFARSFDFTVDYHQPGAPDTVATAAALQAPPLMAFAAPGWYCDSGVFGPIEAGIADRYPEYRTLFVPFLKQFEQGLWPLGGMAYFDEPAFAGYGDARTEPRRFNQFPGRGFNASGCMLKRFLVTGDRQLFDWACGMIECKRDLHYARLRLNNGARVASCDEPTNTLYGWNAEPVTAGEETPALLDALPKPLRNPAAYWGMGQQGLRDLIWHYELTGDRLSFETARDAAECKRQMFDYYADLVDKQAGFRHPESGFAAGIVDLLDLYELTGDVKWRDSEQAAVAEFIRRLPANFPADGLEHLSWDAGEPQPWWLSAWLRAGSEHVRVTGDTSVLKPFVEDVMFYLHDHWWDDAQGCLVQPGGASDRQLRPLGVERFWILPGLAYAYLATKNQDYLDMIRKIDRSTRSFVASVDQNEPWLRNLRDLPEFLTLVSKTAKN